VGTGGSFKAKEAIAMNKTRNDYVEMLKLKLDGWNADIDHLQMKMKKSKADAAKRYQKQIAEIKAQRQALKQKMGKLQGAGEDAWADIKKGVEAAKKTLAGSIRLAKSRFN
jgi:lipid II:glycine glycyltransferase (peptidoglycan interpeptide bridge formation enzyme)